MTAANAKRPSVAAARISNHVKACEGLACTLLFADHTRGHARR
jgi:predicted RNA-binding Zn ribbon-like protein